MIAHDNPGRGRLSGRTILVVGAGTQTSDDPDAPIGNGRAIAVRAGREGATVVCADRDRDLADETVRQVTEAGGTAVTVVGDVTAAEDCAAIVAEAAAVGHSASVTRAAAGTGTAGEPAATGDRPLWGVVLNVGTGLGRGLEGTTAEDWDATFAANLRSHFLVAREALARIAEGGSLLFIGSVAGLQPGSRLPAYDASKAGLIGLCRHAALEGARRGVRANVLAPGLIDTPLGRRATAGRPSRARTPVPLGRQGSAWEVASTAVFLLSDDASYITGQVLAVDGGLSLI